MERRLVPDWLKNLQENSWELELLISGGAIFTLFQITEVFIDWIVVIRITSHITGTGIMLIAGVMAIKILTIGFSVHLALRAYWLALVCINYVYPNGVSTHKISWKRPYTVPAKEGDDLQDQIMAVDRIAGIFIFISIVSVFVLLGLFLIATALLASSALLIAISETVAHPIVMGLVVLFGAYVFDLFCFGLLRKIPLLSYFFFPFFKVFDIISLRGSYQRALFLLHTNAKRPLLVGAALLFFTVAFGLTYLNLYQVQHWPNIFDRRAYRHQMANSDPTYFFYYRDQWEEGKTYHMGINSKVQSSNFLDLFLIYDAQYNELIEQAADHDSLRSMERIINIEIDGQLQRGLAWHPTRLKNHAVGISAMIPIEKLNNGPHTLTVYSEQRYSHALDENAIEEIIPFWVDRNTLVVFSGELAQ